MTSDEIKKVAEVVAFRMEGLLQKYASEELDRRVQDEVKAQLSARFRTLARIDYDANKTE